ncbi:TFIIB-type zinc ribbon-containing protein [Methanobrevibacter sp.]|uniref:TFIIB-type zinc ribbon-containing protein n=1 Tax=Methanobrevibacter sp. TaxID=66852 RepID=UPI0038642A71
MKHADSFCPICKSSDYSLLDEHMGETFCVKCGLVLHESNNRKSIVELFEETGKNKGNSGETQK